MRLLTRFFYHYGVKPILFLFPADAVHTFFLKSGKLLGRCVLAKKLFRFMWRYDNTMLEQDVVGLHIKNPIGLSAGFDYNADLVRILPYIGFGFHTVGTLTEDAYQGNPPPMLGRLPKSKSLLVNKGFKNEGVNNVLSVMPKKDGASIRGVSIGATNKPYEHFDQMVENLVQGFKSAEKYDSFDYYELNISCPNLKNIQNLTDSLASPSGLKKTLDSLTPLYITRPVFIKMPLERKEDEVRELLDIAAQYFFVTGVIFANLAKNRNNPSFHKSEIECAGTGNFSGKPLEEKSNELLAFVYKTYGKRFFLVGVGGVFTAEDAYKKILLGASLVQMITGMVYMGPSQIGIINKELVKFLKRDGYTSISDAIGKGV